MPCPRRYPVRRRRTPKRSRCFTTCHGTAKATHDYANLRLSLKTHPLALLRKELAVTHVIQNERLAHTTDGTRVTVAGIALVRQRPGTAGGVIFITLEDETAVANIVVWPKTFERYRQVVMGARLIRVTGKLQREESSSMSLQTIWKI